MICFVRGLPPLPIYLLTLGLLIAGCNDSAIPEIEFEVPDQELISQLIPNEEPPELVAAYHNLWNEMERERLDGELDSTKVMRANRLAVDLPNMMARWPSSSKSTKR